MDVPEKRKKRTADSEVISAVTDTESSRRTRSGAASKNKDDPPPPPPPTGRRKKNTPADRPKSVDAGGDNKSVGNGTRKRKKTDIDDKAAVDEVKNNNNADVVEQAAKSGGGKKSHKTITVKGGASVDTFCPTKESVHVYSVGGDIYDVMLNQTAVQRNNNKYYVIQLLESDAGNKSYSVWQRWGRVGYDGQNKLDKYGADLEQAKRSFCKKFIDKTGNNWNDRVSFAKRAGKYDMVEIDYTSKEKDAEEDNDDDAAGGGSSSSTKPKSKPKEPPPSTLPESVQDLLRLICDIRAMENAVKEMKYDATKAPLGKLTAAQIKAGYEALKNIEACVERGDFGSSLIEACNEFYTRIPHYFGMKTPPLIRDRDEIKQKIQLLEALNDIEVAIRTIGSADEANDLNPVDKHYNAMKCSLAPIDRTSEEFVLLDEYMTNTRGPTHTMYKMELLNAYRCSKEGEDEKFTDLGNRLLLWHGSRLTNWYGILSQGLRIAPPEAPVTGYMFGKGVYFADMSSKSANYCYTTTEKNVGLLVLCEVSLGKTRELTRADYNADKLPDGFHSTKGIGRTIPDESGFKTLESGCIVPCGKPIETGNRDASLIYNEYIVYDIKQIKMKYLLQVKFLY